MRIRSRSLIASLTLLVGALSCAARAQSPAPWTADSITSRALGVVRFRVSLPPNYAAEAARNDHYPIAIVAGADDKDAQAALVANLRLLGGPLSPAVPSLIIVGMPRFSDGGTTLVPHGATSARFFNRRSVADEAADFVATELVPWLREHFRTTPYTVIAGHSDPGWFAIYAFARYPDVFQGAVAVSPAYWRVDEASNDDTLSGVDAALIARREPGRLFVAVGSWDPVAIRRGVDRFVAQVRGAKAPLEFDALQSDNHQTARLQGYIDGFRWMFLPISLSNDRMYAMMGAFGPVSRASLIAAYDSTKASYARGAQLLGLPTELPQSYLQALVPLFASPGDSRKELLDVARRLCEDSAT